MRFWALIAAMATVSLGAPSPALAQYTFTTLDAGAANGTNAYGLNNSGQVVGATGGNGFGVPVGFVENAGAFSAIHHPMGDFGTEVHGINDVGQMVGWYQQGANQNTRRAFLYADATYTTLSVPLGVFGDAFDINELGQIVGSYTDTGGNYHGFLYSGGGYTTLDAPLASALGGQAVTVATGINDSGQIVGYYQDEHGGSAFLYNGGAYTTLYVPGATGATIAQGINNLGQIVGWFQDPTGNHAFVYDGGAYTTFDGPSSQPGLTLAYGINNAGQIVGTYGSAGESARGFLAIPRSAVPEPSGWLFMLIGFGLLGGALRLRCVKPPAILRGEAALSWA